MAHGPEWHLLDNGFPDANTGIPLPTRVMTSNGARLEIANLDRTDPPGYVAGGVPRGEAFNANALRLTPKPTMPRIAVTCTVAGFDPATTPILWRLVVRHVLCRHTNTGNFRYRGASEVFEREWRGTVPSASFTLFDERCTYTFNDATRVLGGHAILAVAVVVPGGVLQDFVHLRIAGTNPAPPDVLAYVDERLAAYDVNVVRMVRAIFAHESNFTQFNTRAQTATAMTFARKHHGNDAAQPDCRVRFDWPDDPPNFPLASFDFGVGISQYTRVGQQRVSGEIAWDWRENIRRGINLFLDKLKRNYDARISWRHWALAGWRAYNGSGAAAEQYAQKLSQSDDGSQIPFTEVGALPQVALLPAPSPLGAPGPWAVA